MRGHKQAAAQNTNKLKAAGGRRVRAERTRNGRTKTSTKGERGEHKTQTTFPKADARVEPHKSRSSRSCVSGSTISSETASSFGAEDASDSSPSARFLQVRQ